MDELRMELQLAERRRVVEDEELFDDEGEGMGGY